MPDILFQRDCSGRGCSCETDAEQEDFIYLCRKCGGGYIFENGVWTKKFSFNEEAMNEIMAMINS